MKNFLGDQRFLGSTLALGVGILMLVSQDGQYLTSSWMLILGSLAYKSAKKRMLGEVQSTTMRTVIELVALASVLFLWLMENNLRILIIEDPFPHLIIPLWVIIAYLSVRIKHKEVKPS